MPDWNPAEIIGFKPNPLSLSLYESLITNNIWAKQRYEFGYRKIKKPKLLQSFAGTPYVSINKSLESFIPKLIPINLSKKILSKSIELLKSNKSKHDKIEFEIIPNCLDFNFHKWRKLYESENFNNNQINLINSQLLEINKNSQKIYKKYSNLLPSFEKLYLKINNFNKKDKIKRFLKICKKDLTLMFAHFARCGFISVIIFKSALQNKKISKKNYNNFFNSVNTVSKTFQNDMNLYSKKILSKKNILNKYGHLRPGTYDITSERYDKNFNLFFNAKKKHEKKLPKNIKNIIFNKRFLNELNFLGFSDNKDQLIEFFYGSIEKREYSKFLFTKYLSQVLKLISIEFKKYNLNNEEISMLSVKDIFNFIEKKINFKKLKLTINDNRKKYNINKKCDLPNLILSNNDFQKFELMEDEPNFVGDKICSGNILFVKNFRAKKLLDGKIIIINSADPGYDWIFNYKIKGLITKFGGVNSHMAIRCAELNLPAAIGVGEKIFLDLTNSSKIILNPKNKSLEII